jgi:hypothetical protein
MVGNLSARVRRLEEKRHRRHMVFVVRNEEDPPHPDEDQPWCCAFVVRQLDGPGGQPAASQAIKQREGAD